MLRQKKSEVSCWWFCSSALLHWSLLRLCNNYFDQILNADVGDQASLKSLDLCLALSTTSLNAEAFSWINKIVDIFPLRNVDLCHVFLLNSHCWGQDSISDLCKIGNVPGLTGLRPLVYPARWLLLSEKISVLLPRGCSSAQLQLSAADVQVHLNFTRSNKFHCGNAAGQPPQGIWLVSGRGANETPSVTSP